MPATSEEHWIPSSLPNGTKKALRQRMKKPPSEADEPGCIYALGYQDEDGVVTMKIGRTTGLRARLRKECGNYDLLGDVKVTTCHLVKTLVELELAGLMRGGSTPSCEKCGSRHRIFFLGKDDAKKKWQKVVKPIIEKWARFAEELQSKS